MIALTKEKRDDYIRQLTDAVEDLTALKDDTDAQWIIAVYKIALSSLTSRPAAEIKCLEDFSLEVVNVSDGFSLGRHAVFTAPPVPEIKLPEYMKQESSTCGFIDGFNDCLDEIKQINGWG